MNIVDVLLGFGCGFILSLLFINYIVEQTFERITIFTINPEDFIQEIEKADKDDYNKE